MYQPHQNYAIFSTPLIGKQDRHGYDLYDLRTGKTVGTYVDYRDALAAREALNK